MQEFKAVPEINQILETFPETKFFLWDMDGTLMQTEELHTEATKLIIEEENSNHGLSYESIDQACFGLTDSESLKKIQQFGLLKTMNHSKFIDKKTQFILKKATHENSNKFVRKEVYQFLESTKLKNIKCAVVTSSEKDVAIGLLKALDLYDYFEFVLTREDTSENKPLPMPYLEAVKKFNSDKSECFIFEDSPTGLAAAKSSGIKHAKVSWY